MKHSSIVKNELKLANKHYARAKNQGLIKITFENANLDVIDFMRARVKYDSTHFVTAS
jgi:hypothetical protein